MDAKDTAAIRRQVQGHLKVFWILLVMVAANVAVTFLPLSVPAGIVLHLALAAVCAGLVLSVYMHLLSETASTYMVLGCTGFLCLALVGLILGARASTPGQTEHHTADVPAAESSHHVP